MSNRLYVANISFNATDADLKNHFASSGMVQEAKILNDRDTGRSRGFGFVTMASSNDAENAIQNLNNQDFLGRRLFVSVARDRNERGPSNFANQGNGNRSFGSARNDSGGAHAGSRSQGRPPDVAYRNRDAGFNAFERGFPDQPAGFDRPDRGARRARNNGRDRYNDEF